MVISDAMVGQELRARPPASKVYPAELLQQIHILDHVLERDIRWGPRPYRPPVARHDQAVKRKQQLLRRLINNVARPC